MEVTISFTAAGRIEYSDDDDLAKSDHERQNKGLSVWLTTLTTNGLWFTCYTEYELTSPRANGCLSKRLAGKELSNPLIADDLLKIIWLSMYHGLTNLNIG
ncbi:hypothetical protein Tco_0925669 [Tanacetum coccineum]|uniref:Uncharacterized protein n=1 Tax=Tanacetum coccineum TaxID=301880 RepID=A0ABQ5D7J2_9ASTR